MKQRVRGPAPLLALGALALAPVAQAEQAAGELPRTVISADRLGTDDGSVIAATGLAGDALFVSRAARRRVYRTDYV